MEYGWCSLVVRICGCGPQDPSSILGTGLSIKSGVWMKLKTVRGMRDLIGKDAKIQAFVEQKFFETSKIWLPAILILATDEHGE